MNSCDMALAKDAVAEAVRTFKNMVKQLSNGPLVDAFIDSYEDQAIRVGYEFLEVMREDNK